MVQVGSAADALCFSALSRRGRLIALGAVIVFFVACSYFDFFDRLAAFVSQNQFLEWEELFVVLSVLGVAFIACLVFGPMPSPSPDQGSRREFAKELAGYKDGAAAVFIVEGEDLEQETFDGAVAQLEQLTGEGRVTFFRVR